MAVEEDLGEVGLQPIRLFATVDRSTGAAILVHTLRLRGGDGRKEGRGKGAPWQFECPASFCACARVGLVAILPRSGPSNP